MPAKGKPVQTETEEDMSDDARPEATDAHGFGSPRSVATNTSEETLEKKKKRKKTDSPESPNNVHTNEGQTGASKGTISFITMELKAARYKIGVETDGGQTNQSKGLLKIVDRLISAMDNWLRKDSPPASPAKKRLRDDPITDLSIPNMVDSATDMELTPSWWDSEDTRAKQVGLAKPQVERRNETHPHTEADLDLETDQKIWRVQRSRKNPPGKKLATEDALHSQNEQTNHQNGISTKLINHTLPKLLKRAPAVMVKTREGDSYADTVSAVRKSSGINLTDSGAQITAMRKTRDGHLLLELRKGHDSEAAAAKLSQCLSAKLGESVGAIHHMSTTTEVEILDLDAVATREEITTALLDSIKLNNPETKLETDVVTITGLWATRSGNQIATVKLPRTVATTLTRIPVGWIMCRVRPRTILEKCYRCHGFGHTSRNCTDQDLTTACRRCGLTGHHEKKCEAGEDRCVACDRANMPRVPHKPGSGLCQARRVAYAAKANPPRW